MLASSRRPPSHSECLESTLLMALEPGKWPLVAAACALCPRPHCPHSLPVTPVWVGTHADPRPCARFRSHHHERRRSSEEELLEMVLRERSAALSAGAGGGSGGGGGSGSGQLAEQSLVDLLSQGLPAGHPDTDLVAMIMSEVHAAAVAGCAHFLSGKRPRCPLTVHSLAYTEHCVNSASHWVLRCSSSCCRRAHVAACRWHRR
jgi:hypothetical protein